MSDVFFSAPGTHYNKLYPPLFDKGMFVYSRYSIKKYSEGNVNTLPGLANMFRTVHIFISRQEYNLFQIELTIPYPKLRQSA